MAGILITCEHASCAVPSGVSLGLSDAVMRSHVSTDRGAERIARGLAGRLEAPLHVGRFSRLVVDLNRREDNPAVIVERTHGIEVPGNLGLSDAERRARVEAWHRPYRERARADALSLAARGSCLHLSVHSFDPSLDPDHRDFDVGVLFDPARSPEREIAVELAEELTRAGWSARRNEPYAGTPEGLTSWLRSQIPQERYVGLEIECAYRWVDDEAEVERFVGALARGVIQ